MKQSTRDKVWQALYDFAMSQLPKRDRWTLEDIKLAYPFHKLMFSEEAILSARVERSIVTTMGDQLYPALAKIIAEDRYTEVFTEYAIEGTVNDAASNMVEQIVTELRTPRRQRTFEREPDHESELTDILNSRGGGQISRAVTADLYIRDFANGPLFVELKTPLPNLDVASESKRKMLAYLLIMNRQGVNGAKAFLGLTYNPYISRERYTWSFTKQIMDMERQVLMGDELWDMLGGPNTYVELLHIIDGVYDALPDIQLT